MKRYMGPFKSRSEITINVASHSVDRVDHHTPASGAPYSVVSPGTCPASVTTFNSLYTPRFNELSEEGWVIQCPYSRVQEAWDYTPCVVSDTTREGSPIVTNSGTYVNMVDYFQFPHYFPSTGSPSGFQQAKDEVLTRVYSKANSSNADLIIELSQLKQTIMMFINALRTLKTLMSDPRHFLTIYGRLRDGRERYVRVPPDGRRVPVSSLSGLWCELRFGWRPLLGTLEGIVEALTRNDLDQVKRITYRSTENFDYVDEKTSTFTSSLLGFTAKRLYTRKTKFESGLRAGILVEDFFTLRRALGLDWRYIPIAAWDAVPLSFIVDRFVNVGNYIRSLQPIPSVSFGGSWIVDRFVRTDTWTSVHESISASSGSGPTFKQWIRVGGENRATLTSSGVIRSIHEQAPSLPTLRHDWSQFTNLYNLIDALVLAIQRLPRKHQ